MQKHRRWQFFVIIVVLALTLYNILPTIFYYGKPLHSPIDEKKALTIENDFFKRADQLSKDSSQWISSFCKMLHLHPKEIFLDPNTASWIHVKFQSADEAQKFQKHLPRSGLLINPSYARLNLSPFQLHDDKEVIVSRAMPLSIHDEKEFCNFSFKKDQQSGKITPTYKKVVFERVSSLAEILISKSELNSLISSILYVEDPETLQALILGLGQEISEFTGGFSEDSGNFQLLQRYFSSGALALKDGKKSYDSLIRKIDLTLNHFSQENEKLQKNPEDPALKELEKKTKILTNSKLYLQKYLQPFTNNEKSIFSPYLLALEYLKNHQADTQDRFVLDLGDRNPFIQSLSIDWQKNLLLFQLYPNVLGNLGDKRSRQLEQLFFNEIARIKKFTDEQLSQNKNNEYVLPLTAQATSQSFLLLDTQKVKERFADQIFKVLQKYWAPEHKELLANNFPLINRSTFENLTLEQKALCLVINPAFIENAHGKNSLCVVAKGIARIFQKYSENPSSLEAKLFLKDFYDLQKIMDSHGFYLVPPSGNSLDLVFENRSYLDIFLQATQEKFSLHGFGQNVLLEFGDFEHRIRTINQIDTEAHENLVKWKEDYHNSLSGAGVLQPYDIAPVSKNLLYDNFILSLKKYFRGDERKIIHWGLDLSGGKSVQIELLDHNHNLVSAESDIKQGINELFNRVNKMGVSEVNIRKVNSNIVLDFPGSQNISAQELIQGSSMYFHIVNEKFSHFNHQLSDAVDRFLQDIWNEAQVKNRTDIESIEKIAWKYLYGEPSSDLSGYQPLTESGKTLYENGLRLASPLEHFSSNDFDLNFSKIVKLRGNGPKDWHGQPHPLMIVFNNYALEGSQLENIHSGYDPSKGNFLTFGVKSSSVSFENKKVFPRETFYRWTSHFAKDRVQGTEKQKMSHGEGWRMAVVLNNSVITAPTLMDADLRQNASISGNFSQREIQQLVSDLKAGSLSYTPHILSEKNISPELGHHERAQGILAAFVALFCVVTLMILYYRFFGFVASFALIFNLLFLWATLQNIQATLTLAGIAGVVLTLGMALDANVLVFERFREDFSQTGRLLSSIETGYKKAYSAIIDSNVTTILAALILFNFDAGPIKGFAITLIIGIVSSLFSALFMTKYYLSGWALKPSSQNFKLKERFSQFHFNFLKMAKPAIFSTLAILLVGGILWYHQKNSVLGMDFTGGASISFEVLAKDKTDYRKALETALHQEKISAKDFQIQQLSSPRHIRLSISNMLKDKVMPENLKKAQVDLVRQAPTHLTWLSHILKKANLDLTHESMSELDTQWTVMSGKMSESMRNHAIQGILIALAVILIYLSLRFEFKYALSSIICLAHDVLFSLAAISILHFIGVDIQLDLHAIAAIMTIVGYSLNDTIIVFDRIRQEGRFLYQRKPFPNLVNDALNATLTRTTMTSATTLIALLALVIFGGSSLFGFSLIMSLGVIFGTLSSLFIASPCVIWLNGLQEKKREKRETAI